MEKSKMLEMWFRDKWKEKEREKLEELEKNVKDQFLEKKKENGNCK